MLKLASKIGLSRGNLIFLYDVAWVSLSLPLAVAIRSDFRPVTLDNIVFDTFLMGLIACLVYWLFGAHRQLWRYVSASSLQATATWVTVITLTFTVSMFLIDRMDGLARSVIIVQWLLAIMGLWIARIIYSHTNLEAANNTSEHHSAKPLLLVGSADAAALFVRIIRQGIFTKDFYVAGIITQAAPLGRTIDDAQVLGTINEFDHIINRLKVRGIEVKDILVTQSSKELGDQRLERLMQRSASHDINIFDLTDLVRLGDSPKRRFDRDVLDPIAGDPSFSGGVRRLIDIVAGALLLVFFSPILLILALLVRSFISGNIFFSQSRPGMGMRKFLLRKFCTMRDPIGPHGEILSDEERTSTVGRLIRRTRLDELPQFYHVLSGEMSLIGPRPLLVKDLPDATSEQLTQRFSVRPGITGWAQVNGGHSLSSEEKLALDLWYINNRSLSLDLTIVFATVKMMLFGEMINAAALAEARQAFDAELAKSGTSNGQATESADVNRRLMNGHDDSGHGHSSRLSENGYDERDQRTF